MSIAAISYKSLNNAAGEAKDVSKKLDKYASELNNTVYKKLNSYKGSWTSNLSSAKNSVHAKISQLENAADDYDDYSENLKELRDECKRVDKSVKSRVSKLTSQFKKNNGIRDSKIENAISFHLTKFGNSTSAGRWLGDKIDRFRADADDVKREFKTWWNYEGGKQAVIGIAVAALEVAIGVVSVVAAIATFIAGTLTFGAVVLLVAGVVGGVIAVANGVTNLKNEKKAYAYNQSNDPATAKRRSDLNTYTDTLRKDSDDRKDHIRADVIDIIDTACTVVSLVNSASNLLKNGYKWATGSAEKVSKISLKEVFKKENFGKFAQKFKNFMGEGLTNLKQALKYHDWSIGKDVLKHFTHNLADNLKGNFLDFSDFKSGLSSLKSILGLGKDIIDEDWDLGKIYTITCEDILFPGLTAFTVNQEVDFKFESDGQMRMDFFDDITIDDVYSPFKKGFKLTKDSIKKLSPDPVKFDVNLDIPSGTDIDIDFRIEEMVMSKLHVNCDFSIAIPEIDIPPLSMPVIRAAA